MRRAIWSVFMVLLLAGGEKPAAQDAGSSERSAIVAIIQQQIAAFQRDDGPAAFAFASPTIQQIFGNPDRFMQMVREGYPPVYRPQDVEFLALSEEAGRLVQRVRIVGPGGETVIARYTMIRMPDGSWRIDGCVLERPPGQYA